jgi:hypothetical protein
MIPAEIEEELIDIKRELDRREMRGAPTRENNALRERHRKAPQYSKTIAHFFQLLRQCH